jgi:hypothetical protein
MTSISRAGLHWQAPYNLWAILIASTLSLQPSTDLELQESAQARTEALMRLNY